MYPYLEQNEHKNKKNKREKHILFYNKTTK